MKKALLAGALTFMLSDSLMASVNHDLGLVSSFPLPMQVLLKYPQRLDITEAQSEKVSAIAQSVPSIMHERFEEVEALEKEIKHALIEEGKTKEQLSVQLDKLQTLKRMITDKQIDTINEIRTFLTPEQFKKMLEIQKKMQKKQKKMNKKD